MRGLHTEHVLKGVFLGLLLYVAVNVKDPIEAGYTAACAFGGLVLCLLLSAVLKFFRGFRVGGKPLAFLIFLVLDSPNLVYTGILSGTAVAALYVRGILPMMLYSLGLSGTEAPPPLDESQQWQLVGYLVAGAVLGFVFGILRQVQVRLYRVIFSLLLASGFVVIGLGLLNQLKDFGSMGVQFESPIQSESLFSWVLILGIPLFYLLTLSGRDEESEVEIAAMCGMLGLGLWVLLKDAFNLVPFRSAAFLLPLCLYFVYTIRILPGLRVFKHVLRGIGYLEVKRFRPALLAFRRALQLDPRNPWAREELWNLHRSLDVRTLPNDPELLKLIDFDLCLDRAGSLLLQAPKPPQLEEAGRLLDLVLSQRPRMLPRVRYWRAVAHTHSRQIDRAVEELEAVLTSRDCALNDPQRQVILVQAWQLGLILHDDLRHRVGYPVLSQPGRRLEAIAAVEKHLVHNPSDKGVGPLKQLLYQDVTEAEYDATSGGGDLACPHFDHPYAQHLGLALINDANRWERGGEYLRMAARGMPTAGPAIFIHIAQAHDRAGNPDGAWRNYDLAKKAGEAVGPKNLSDEDRNAFFATVKMLGDDAIQRDDVLCAIENYRLYMESERSGVETLRTLAGLYEKKGDALAALWMTEQALLYSGNDRDLKDRKDKYYYSVMPEDLQRRIESVRNGFDTKYCLDKAKSLLDARNTDLDVIDWAQHLLALARVMQPDNLQIKLLMARCLIRRGMTSEAVEALEAMRNPKPERFGGSDEEEAWHVAMRLLGDLYLKDLGKPDLAVACYNEYRRHPKSGADTLYKLGEAHEQLGDRAKAYRYFEQVTAYEQHPLAGEARSALVRLRE
jgi:tetratricopeptide (TPR) repeat protein